MSERGKLKCNTYNTFPIHKLELNCRQQIIIYTIICLKSVCLSVCLSVSVRRLQVAILARLSREMSLTVRIV